MKYGEPMDETQCAWTLLFILVATITVFIWIGSFRAPQKGEVKGTIFQISSPTENYARVGIKAGHNNQWFNWEDHSMTEQLRQAFYSNLVVVITYEDCTIKKLTVLEQTTKQEK